jgi:hypothetical protein
MTEGTRPVKHILSFGGGVNTVALMVLLTEEGAPLDEAVFADTGAEVPETYEYLTRASTYLEQRGIPLRIVSRRAPGRNLYDTSWQREVFPSAIWRWSTRDFKVRPIYAYYRSLDADVVQYVGIAYDEVHRMKDSLVPFVTNCYPLVDKKLGRQGCIEVIQKAGLPLPVKSGCFFCPFNSLDRWQWLLTEHPDLFERAVALEEHSKHFPSQRLTDQVFRNRATMTLRELGDALRAGKLALGTEIESPCGGACMT